jgi:ABC-type branched-subunit amino acid transport system ATPase component
MGDEKVLHDRHLPERPGYLMGAADAVPCALLRARPGYILAQQLNGPLAGDRPGEQADERALAGAVRADHAEHLTAAQCHVDAVDRAGVAAGYGAFRALHDVSFSVAEGEVLALLGANGAGKTTTARAVSGMLPVSTGEIWFDGKRISGRPPHDIVRLGVAHCMEGRKIFGDLTVEENLLLGARAAGSSRERAKRLEAVYEVFDALRERRGNSGFQLSGGQQQMLAIGRALMADPRLIIFDEISLGLAPIMVDRLYETLTEINGRGVAMIVIEQNVERGLALADHVAVLEKGRVALTGEPAQMRADERLLGLYIGEAKDPASDPAPAG